MRYLKALGRRLYQLLVRYPIAIPATIALVIAAIVLACFGQKFQIGGLLGKLWGKQPGVTPNIRTTVVAGRVDDNGKPIEPGKPDDRGFVQVPVSTEIKQPGIFSNPDTITIVDPDKGEVILPLPVGVKNKDVREVVKIGSDAYEIRNNDSGVDIDDVRDSLK
jgi:hypothetical protein